MSASLWVVVINFLLGQVQEAWTAARQQHGEAIPTIETLLAKNRALQAEIDAELKKGGPQ
jgi:capsule polysaccharide export protein KpsE/RkpR